MSIPSRATRFVWLAAGSPPPVETDGSPIRARDWKVEAENTGRKLRKKAADARAAGDKLSAYAFESQIAQLTTSPHCACCGEPATHLLADAISDSFSTVKNESRGRPFGGGALCAGCTWCHKNLALRSALWFARPEGIWFGGTWALKGMPWFRPSAIDMLLNPPEPPFVAAYPLAGVDHGGEDALERCMLSPPPLDAGILAIRECMSNVAEEVLAAKPPSVKSEDAKKIVMRSLVTLAGWPQDICPPWPSTVDWKALIRDFGRYRFEPWWRWAVWPLIKLQSKHTAIYAQISGSQALYHLQVDDARDFTLDVELWRRMRGIAEPLLVDMRRQGVGAREATDAVTRLRVPFGYRVPMRAWRETTAPMRAHHEAPWWPIFVSMLRMPELTLTHRRKA